MNVPHRRKFASRQGAKTEKNSVVSFGLSSQTLSLFYLAITISALLPLIVYAHLGTYSRYGADDYCATMQLLNADNFWQASVTRYLEWSGGYSNLLFIQIGEWFGIFGMVLMVPVALVMWLIGLTWMFTEIGEASGLRWKIRFSFVLAALAIFFSLFRTPSLHKILFWRSSLVGYLAALVLLAYLVAFICHQLRGPLVGSRLLWSCFAVFVGVFITGGTSETIDALQIGILLLSLMVLLPWKTKIRRETILLLGTGLVSAILSMVIMIFSPGNLVRMGVSVMPMPDLFSLGIETLTYVFQFGLNNLTVSPLPALICFVMPILLICGLQSPPAELSSQWATKMKWMILLFPLAMLILIAFSFAPHAYARSFPSAYVRFPALFLLTLTLLAEGCLVGYLLSQIKFTSSTFFRAALLGVVLLIFLYPLRAATKLYSQVPEYRAHTLAWDSRDQSIRQAVAGGAADLVVVQLDTIGGVQEYKGRASFWVNRCAAGYYGLHTLSAP